MTEASPGEARLPRGFLATAGALTAAAVILLGELGLPWVDAGTLGLILVLLPILAVAQARLLGDLQIERLRVYLSSFVTLVALGGLCAVAGWRQGGADALGLSAPPRSVFVAWTVGLTVGGVAVLFAFRRALMALDREEAAVVEALIPRSKEERYAFAALSLAAGLGEEIAYRGYAIAALTPVTGTTGAAVLTTVVFGVLHAYQGPQGMVRAGLLGGLLAWGFLAGGSLWPPIVTHALLDILAGIFLADRLAVRRDRDGVPTPV
jgi:membrane protease YdiL (CAAX protease family)